MHPTRGALAALLAVGIAFVAMPTGEPWRSVLGAVIGTAAVAVAVAGRRRIPRARRRPWTLLTTGLACYVLGDVGLLLWWATAGAPPPLAGPLHLLYPAGALLVAAALIAAVPAVRSRDVAIAIDAIIVTASVGTVVGVLAIAPARQHVTAGVLSAVHMGSYTLAHVLLVVALVRFAMASSWTTPAARRLAAGAGTLILTAVTVSLLVTLGVYAPTTLVDLGWMGAYVLLAAAVLGAASSETVAERPRSGHHRATPQLVLLTAALLLLPAAEVLRATDAVDLTFALATSALLLLLLLRLVLLLRELRGHWRRDLVEAEQSGRRRLEALVRHASDALLVLGADDRVSYATPSARGLIGQDPMGWTSRDLLGQLHPGVREETRRRLQEGLRREPGRPVRLQTRLLDHADTERHLEVVAVDLTDDPDLAGVVLTFHDASERLELERRLRHLAYHDALTGLCNRELLSDRLAAALDRAARRRRPVAVLLCDLDDFKDVNDTYGHGTGDAMLTVIAQRLHDAARSRDTVARLGGDEFAILCEGLDRHAAIEVARRVLAALDAPIHLEGGRVLRAGASIGIAVDDGGRCGQELLRDADIALYEAKADGKRGWSVHHRTMTERAHARLELASELTRAIEQERLEVAFQPIVRLPDHRILGVEALARWRHPRLGWVSPAEFIPLAEETGEINRLGDIVLRTALAAMQGWFRAEPDLDLRLAVNVSGRQVRDPELPDRVASRLREFGVAPERLVLELTESVMVDEDDDAIGIMERLRALGVRFALDDFGTGYSSLACLRRLPIDIIKTDRAFVREIGRDEASSDLVRAVLEMGRSLRLDVVAEGVETRAQREALLGMGARLAQGFLFARPASATALAPRLLADHAAHQAWRTPEPALPDDADVAVAAPAGAPPPGVDG